MGTNSQIKRKLSRLKWEVLLSCLRVYDRISNTEKALNYKLIRAGFFSSDYSFSSDQVMFMHVPKTGGTSLERIFSSLDQSKFYNLSRHNSVSKHCSPKDYKYITVMRNPIDRVWSQYQMVLREVEGYHGKKYAKKGFPCFIENLWYVQNLMCRMLTANPDQKPDEESLTIAKGNLNHFTAIIDFEFFENEVMDFLDQQGFDYDKESFPNERKSSYEQPTSEEIELIKEHNQLDIQLYDYWSSSLR